MVAAGAGHDGGPVGAGEAVPDQAVGVGYAPPHFTRWTLGFPPRWGQVRSVQRVPACGRGRCRVGRSGRWGSDAGAVRRWGSGRGGPPSARARRPGSGGEPGNGGEAGPGPLAGVGRVVVRPGNGPPTSSATAWACSARCTVVASLSDRCRGSDPGSFLQGFPSLPGGLARGEPADGNPTQGSWPRRPVAVTRAMRVSGKAVVTAASRWKAGMGGFRSFGRRGAHVQRRHLPYLPRLGHRNLSPDHDGPPPNRPRSHNLTTGCSCHWVPSTALRSGERPAERDDSCGAPCPVLAQGSVLGEQGRDDDEGRSNFPTRCSEVGQTCSGDLPTHCVALAGARRAVRGRARTRVRRCRTGRT